MDKHPVEESEHRRWLTRPRLHIQSLVIENFNTARKGTLFLEDVGKLPTQTVSDILKSPF